jgi:hypothetical protein
MKQKEVIEEPWRVARGKWQACEAMIGTTDLPETEPAVQWPSRDASRAGGSRRRAEMQAALHVHDQPGGPHYPASVIDIFR